MKINLQTCLDETHLVNQQEFKLFEKKTNFQQLDSLNTQFKICYDFWFLINHFSEFKKLIWTSKIIELDANDLEAKIKTNLK